MLNPLNGMYGSLIKLGLVVALLASLYGTYKYKVHEAITKAEHVVELRHKDETLAANEVLFTKKRAAEKELEKDFNKRQGEYNEKIKNLTLSRDNLFASLQSRPPRPISDSGNSASPRTEAITTNSTGAGLYLGDAEFLARFATDTETLKLGLLQCYSDYNSVKEAVESFNKK
jgi:hypothetical protein